MNVGIIGGGLSGISLQSYLNCDSVVLEKENHIGGLCSTYEKNGFKYDIGGHALFSKNNEVMNEFKSILSENFHYCLRKNDILLDSIYTKYPFENGLSSLPKDEIAKCLIDFIKNQRTNFSNFKEWIYYTFGDGISDKYLIPYNEKIWKTSLENINTDWVHRIPKPPVEDIIKSAIGINTEGYTHQLNFGYPIDGGIQSLVNSFQNKKSNIKTGFNIREISFNKKGYKIISDDSSLIFDKLVIAAPLIEIMPLIKGIPYDIIKAVNDLKFNTIKIIMIGVNNDSLMQKSCTFIPNNNILPHRICFMGYFSKLNVPENKSSLIAEITTNNNCSINDEFFIEKTIDDLNKISIINKNEISEVDIKTHKYGYVIPDHNYRENINKIIAYSKSIGIYLLGRFGQHEYINMDEVILRSKQLSKIF